MSKYAMTMLFAEIDTLGPKEFFDILRSSARIGQKNPKDGKFDPWENEAWLDRFVLEGKQTFVPNRVLPQSLLHLPNGGYKFFGLETIPTRRLR